MHNMMARTFREQTGELEDRIVVFFQKSPRMTTCTLDYSLFPTWVEGLGSGSFSQQFMAVGENFVTSPPKRR